MPGRPAQPLYYLSGTVPWAPQQHLRVVRNQPQTLRVARPRTGVPDVVGVETLELVGSPALLRVLEDIGATGWVASPVTLVRGQDELTGYARLVVTGRSPRMWPGFHDDHVREEQWAEGGPWVAVHACADPAPDGWDGTDVFSPEGTRQVVVTDRVRRAVEEAVLRVSFDQVGRTATPLFLDDEDGTDREAEWRARTGCSPGQRPGLPVCPVLVGGMG